PPRHRPAPCAPAVPLPPRARRARPDPRPELVVAYAHVTGTAACSYREQGRCLGRLDQHRRPAAVDEQPAPGRLFGGAVRTEDRSLLAVAREDEPRWPQLVQTRREGRGG